MPAGTPQHFSTRDLPETLRPLFWDVAFDELDWAEHSDFIIRRVLVSGPWEAVTELRLRVGDEALAIGSNGIREGR